jgi:hypothetical protein
MAGIVSSELTNLNRIEYPSLDNLPNSSTGQYGLTESKNVSFCNIEQHRLFLLGKFVKTTPDNNLKPNEWDEIYQNAKQKEKLIAVRGSFNEIDLTKEVKIGNNRSMSIIAPASDSVTRPNGYIYEIDPESIQIIFPQDIQTSPKPFPNSKSNFLKDGTIIYARSTYSINLIDIPHIILPRSQRRCSEAIVKFLENTKLVGVFSKHNLSTWATEARKLHIEHIGKIPNLDQNATKEIETYTRKLSKLMGKSEDQIRQLAIETYKTINKLITDKTGDIIIPQGIL